MNKPPWKLNREDSEAFAGALLNPKPPGPKLVEAAQRYVHLMEAEDDTPADPPKEEGTQTACPLSFVATLHEAEGAPGAPPGSVWEVVILQEGWSKNGVYYTRDAVASSVHVFESAPVQFYGWNGSKPGHLPTNIRWGEFGGQGPAANNVGVLSKPYTLEQNGRLESRATFYCTHPILMEQLRQYALLPVTNPLGMSIDANGSTAPGVREGRSGLIVQKLTTRNELTVVVNAAAGGRITRLVASEDTEEDDPMLKAWLKSRRAKKGLPVAGVENLEGNTLLQEAVKDLREDGANAGTLALADAWIKGGKVDEATSLLESLAVEAPPAPAPVPVAAPVAPKAEPQGLEAQGKALLESLRLQERGMELDRRLLAAQLPPKAELVVRNRFPGVFEDADLHECIVNLKEALASVTPVAEVAQGISRVKVGLGPVEHQQAGWDLVFGYDFEKDANMQESEKQIRRDMKRSGREAIPSKLTDRWYDSGDPYHVGPNAHLLEATTADYTNILSTSMEKRMVQVYNGMPDRSEDLVTVVTDIQSFKTQSRLMMGGFGDIATVAESTSADYPYLQAPAEALTEYSLTKRGGLFAITWEMLLADNLQQFRNIPQQLGIAARTKKMKFTYGLCIGGSGLATINADTTYDSLALFHANHANTTTSALAIASMAAARTAIQNQKRFHRSMAIAADYTSGGTSVTFASTAGLGKGDFFQVGAEIFRVTAIASATVATVVGAQCGTAAADHSNGATALIFADPIAVDTFHLLVPTELGTSAQNILNATLLPGGANNDYNYMGSEYKAGRLKIHEVNSIYLLGDVTNWYMIGDKSQVESIEFGYLRGQIDPQIFVADSPTVGAALMRDNIIFKLRQVYGGKQVDWRGMYGALVSD